MREPEIDLSGLLDLILNALQGVVKETTSEFDRSDFEEQLHNLFRLLTVLTYDPKTCELLLSNENLLTTCREVASSMAYDCVLAVHLFSIVRNCSCLGRMWVCVILAESSVPQLTSEEWLSVLHMLLIREWERLKEKKQSGLQCMMFVNEDLKSLQESDMLSLLLSHYMRFISNCTLIDRLVASCF